MEGMPYLKLIVILLLLSQNLKAQTTLSRFSVAQIDDKVRLNWTFTEGFVCTGTTIQRSTDNYAFQNIGQIEGICGSFDEPISYLFEDSFPTSNQINYYRLKLGAFGFSDTLSILFIKYNDQNYSLSPNPLSDKSVLYFENKKSDPFTLRILNNRGMLIREIYIRSNQVRLQRSDFNAGLYFFVLCDTEANCTIGKFLVL
jgi:hypothetical protein